MRFHFFLGVFDGVLRNINASHFYPRQQRRELVKQEPLAAPYVQDPCSRLQIVMINHGSGNRLPASVIVVTAVAIPAFAIPIVSVILNGYFCALRLVVLYDALEIITFG